MGANDYDLQVWGTLRDGEVVGGGKRDYFYDLPLKRSGLGRRRCEWWPGVKQRLVQASPDLVVCPVYPSNLTSWMMPGFCRKRQISCVGWGKVYGKTSNALAMKLKQRLFCKYDRMLVYGNRSLDELCDIFGYERKKVFVTKNTIDTQRIFDLRDDYAEQAKELRKTHQLEGAKVLLCIAKMEHGKRHADLLAAWPMLRELDPKLHLVLAGSGSLHDEIADQCSEMDSERIRFLGRVPAGHDYTWIAASDMTIQCGAVGLAVNQSLAFGKPTIIADEISPDTEALTHGVNGWRYVKGDTASLVEAVKQILTNPAKADDLASQGPITIQNEFSIKNMVNKIHECMMDALGDLRSNSA